jgi:hypothetical protein
MLKEKNNSMPNSSFKGWVENKQINRVSRRKCGVARSWGENDECVVIGTISHRDADQ